MQIVGGLVDVIRPVLRSAEQLRRIGSGLGQGQDIYIVKRALGWLLGSLAGLCLLVSSGWAGSTSAPGGYQSFVDTSGQLTLNDILSNRYANLFVPSAEGGLRLSGAGSAIWVSVPLEHATTYLLELHNPSIARINVYLLQDDLLRVSHSAGMADPRSSIPLPHGGFAFPINVTDTEGKKLLVRLQNDYPITTHLTMVPLNEITRIHIRHQALQGILVGLMLAAALTALLLGTVRRAPLHLLLGLSALLFALSGLSGVGWALHNWAFLHGQTGNLVALAGFVVLAAVLHGAQPIPGTSGGRSERIGVLLAGGLLVAVSIAQPATVQTLLTATRIALPLLMLSLVAIAVLRREAVDLLFGVASLLLLASWLVEYLLGVPPHGVTHHLMDLLLWSALLCYSWSLFRRQQRTTLRQLQQRHTEASVGDQRRARARFLARISHEIRTPMNGVLGMSELLLDTALSAKQRDYVQTIHSSGNDLLDLINDILDLSRLESGQLVLEQSRFDLHSLIDDCLTNCRNRLNHRPIELISFIQPDVPKMMEGDPARLRQIIMSLLNNANVNTDEGEILLVAAMEKQADGPQLLRLAIQDTGHPMSEESRNSLLEAAAPAGHLVDMLERQGQLSLYISQQLVRRMRGQVGIKESSEQGNTLWVMLPADFVESPAEVDLPGHCLADRNILIVDDNATCRKVLQQQASAWQMAARTASSGREALAMLRAQANLNSPFDILLVDQSMPGMSGLELASKIKDDPLISGELLIIMLTGVNQLPSRIVARNAGIRRVLNKPVSGYTLRTTLVDEWLQHSERNRNTAAVEESPREKPDTDFFQVLVAEDNAISSRVIQGMLAKLKVPCDAVDDGEKAIQAVQQGAYDLVLMDCEMHGMDGFTATECIRQWEQQHAMAPVPIIALTAHILPEHRERARLAGMNGHMAKPIDLAQLKALLDYWIKHQTPAGSNH